MRTGAEVIGALGLRPHPEGGWYAETWRAPAADGARPGCIVVPSFSFDGFELAPDGWEPSAT